MIAWYEMSILCSAVLCTPSSEAITFSFPSQEPVNMPVQTIPAPLDGKVAVVTGGSRGIGEETALLFARQGCTHIAITYLSATAAADSVLSKILAIDPGIKTAAIQADVCDSNFGKHVVESALQKLQVDHIDIVVSNAGLQDFSAHASSANMTKNSFDLVMTSQAWAPLHLSLETIKYMPRGGRVILNSSMSSKVVSASAPSKNTYLCLHVTSL